MRAGRDAAMYRPRKRFGQHFLLDRGVLAKIVAAVDPRLGDEVLEIGPGRGALTAPLIDKVGRIRAIEIDRDLARELRERFPPDKLELFETDALRFDYAALPARVRLVGNLPYNISTPLLFRLCASSGVFRDLHLMLQKEVAARMCARPSTPEYGRLSVMIQHWFRVERLFNVLPGAFRPRPKVESAVVRLLPRTAAERGAVDESALRRLVTAAFSRRRKTLRNALSGLLSVQCLEKLGVDPGLRAENLSLADYVVLARQISAPNEIPIPKV